MTAWGNAGPFPPQDFRAADTGICLATASLFVYLHLGSLSDDKGHGAGKVMFRRLPLLLYVGSTLLLFTWGHLRSSFHSQVAHHPLDHLIPEAQNYHKTYLSQASTSKTLSEAVQEYQRRYAQLPPPGFQHWYKFATDRNSAIIDNFDSIHQDLLPFSALSPQEIRDRTWELISNPWNDAAGVMIRNGKTEAAPNILGTHRWMADGLGEMFGKFAEWLPDMDLAFNLNDEPRVVVPYEEMEPMRKAGLKRSGLPVAPGTSFSANRADGWTAIPEEPNSDSPLQEISWQKTFHRYGMLGCPPDSPARNDRLWDTGSLCISCISPQSLGAFLANWSVAADICHQPDLADLHGLYLSPAAFKGTHQLYPIFSQSKVHGFNDILYPSAWNYLDNAKYDPTDECPDKSFAEKDNVLFWRGSTSEGVSKGRGSWRGMTRQRFVHMTNNVNNTAPSKVLLLPTEEPDQYEYINLPSTKLTELLPTDVRVVDGIVRCAGPDCGNQDHEFSPFAAPLNFQAHWKYKYLLDMDGAGFSGRFLPFLQSKSLPFKTALFREWWDDRVTPWLHFVPLDLRGHGLWATLAYFHGLEGFIEGVPGQKGSTEVKINGHPHVAERMAMQGRDWAGKALRKDDMEIYMFRLLLEWGRLTDDKRDTLGFDGNETRST